MCDSVKGYSGCLDGLTECGAMQNGVDAAKSAVKQAAGSIPSCSISGEGGSSVSEGGNTCDIQKCSTDYATAGQAAGSDMVNYIKNTHTNYTHENLGKVDVK